MNPPPKIDLLLLILKVSTAASKRSRILNSNLPLYRTGKLRLRDKKYFSYNFIYFWLCWVFVAALFL